MRFLTEILAKAGITSNYFKLDVATAPAIEVGKIVWNSADGTFDMGLLNDVTLQAGQELHFYGKAVGAISNGQAVMFVGAQGDHALMTLADAATINDNPEYFIGVATQDFANNDFGYVTVLGKVRGLNTSAYTAGTLLYYNSTSATDGLLTSTMPSAPNAKIIVAAVLRSHANQGVLLVRPHTMPKISDIQDVSISSLANNDFFVYESATSVWKNKTIAAALGYTPADDAAVVKLTGNQTVAGVKTFTSALLANNPSGGATGEGLIAGQSFKIDATGTSQRAIMYIVSNVLSDTYGSGLQAQYANLADDKAFGFNLNTIGGFELYVKNTSFVKALTIANTKAATFADTVTATSLIKSGGTSAQFLKADGSVDGATYLTSYTETDTLATVTGRGNTTTTRIGVLTSTPINLAGAGNSGTWIGGTQDAITGWSISNNGIGLKADDTTYATVGIAPSNGILYFARTTAEGVNTLTSWLEVNSAGVANFIRARPQHNGNNLALVSETLQLSGGTLTGRVTFPSAIANRPQLPGGFLGLDTGDGNFDIWGISRDYYPSNPTAAEAWGIRWNGDNNDIEFVGGGNNRVIIDLDNGNVTATTFTGALSGNATTATTATSATSAGSAGTVTHNASRTDAAYYNVGWFAGTPSPAYSCDAVQIQSSTGTLRATTFSGALSGNATTATTATNLTGLGSIQRTDGGISYTTMIQVRETAGYGGNTNIVYAPALGFHWSGVVASSIRMNAGGEIQIVDNPGTSYEALRAGAITGNSFNGAGTGLTGTAASLSIGGNAATATNVAWSGVTSKPSSIFFYEGFTLDANTMSTNASGFTYSINAPYTGPIMRVGDGGYSLQLNASYGGGGTGIAFRTRNGDAGTFNPWRVILNDANYTSYSPSLTGTGASGTWEINITGSSRGVLFSGDSAKQITDGLWAGGGSYPGYQFTGGNSRFGFSSTSGVVDVYADGNFYATDSSHLVWHAGNMDAPNKSGTSYYQTNTWMQFNGNYGLYWPNNYGLHFFPNNDGSYGSAQILGSKNTWRGLHFGEATGMTLMMNETEFGFHRQASGWYARFTDGMGYFNISGNAATATNATASANISLTSIGTASMNVSNGQSAVYRNENGNGGNLSYAPVLHLGGSDTMWQIQGDYYNSSTLQWRAGYAGTWYSWRQILHDANFGNYVLPLTGGSISGILNFGAMNATPYLNATGTSNGISFGGYESSSLRQYGIFTELENVGGNYSKLTLNYHTGIRLGASTSYGGTRFYSDAVGSGTMIFSVGNGDSNVRVVNSLFAAAFFESSDSKLKTLIEDNYQTKGIEAITPKLYTKNGKVELGYYAQDFVGILDSAISKDNDDILSLSYREVLVAKVYALEQEVEQLKAKLN
jgi:hypothetical protein